MGSQIVQFSLNRPKVILWATLLLTLVMGAMFPMIHIDTDPENMLPADQADRVTHNELKQRFSLADMIVVGVVNKEHSDGIYNAKTLGTIHALSQAIATIDGVVREDLRSLATMDNITQEGASTIRFEWLMKEAPTTAQSITAIHNAVMRLPLLDNTVVSGDSKAAGIYVPITEKDQSYRIASEIKAIVKTLNSDDQIFITGLPIAEDTFGVEMFVQMATSAPLAGLVIFCMLWFFFRSIPLIVAPMLMAMTTVIVTMGLLIGMGYTVHIMSSMIPIFLMPIAVVDSVHLLSEFADAYRPGKDPKAVMKEVLDDLFKPMLFTSITSAVGFASLGFTPIPPVQVFGFFVAFGIGLAFFLTVTFIPAYIASLSPQRLAALGEKMHRSERRGLLIKLLPVVGQLSLKHAKPLLLSLVALFAVALYGVSKIQINDNPVQWFDEQHEIQIADKTLNHHFAGTYNAFLVLTQGNSDQLKSDLETQVAPLLDANPAIKTRWQVLVDTAATESQQWSEQLESLSAALQDELFDAPDEQIDNWQQLNDWVEQTLQQSKYFQQPPSLAYIEKLQTALQENPIVGKTSAVTDLIKVVYRELIDGQQSNYRLPDSSAAIAQTLLSFQGSHRPHDLWHMVTPDFRSAAIWLQLNSGDNVDMSQVIEFVDHYIEQNPLPQGVALEWGGLTYINVVWQEEMVQGMVTSLISAFFAVLLIMVILFRSIRYGLMAMIPLTVTITMIYGVVGFIGKDYDMPVAILSSLTLGLSVDFAIHFIQRARTLNESGMAWCEVMPAMFDEPARAISRNALVIAIGFTPLLIAPLVPYQTVGIFLAAIMAISCLVTLVAIPALISLTNNCNKSEQSS